MKPGQLGCERMMISVLRDGNLAVDAVPLFASSDPPFAESQCSGIFVKSKHDEIFRKRDPFDNENKISTVQKVQGDPKHDDS